MAIDKLSFTAFDFETSGVDPEVDLPVEVCAVKVDNGEPVATFNALIYYPDNRPWTEALEKGHHTREDLEKGMNEREVAKILWQLCFGEILVAHNALFDLSFLRAMFMRHFLADGRIPFSEDNLAFIDTCTIARDRDPHPHKLTDVCRRRGIEIGDAHLALDDTLALVELVNKLHEEQDIEPYFNVAGYKRQYGLPKYADWLPENVTIRPQGNESVYHHANGTTTQQAYIGKPHQRVVMGKPVPPQPHNIVTHAGERMAQQVVDSMRQSSDSVFREAMRRAATPPPQPQTEVIKTPFHTITRKLPPPPGN